MNKLEREKERDRGKKATSFSGEALKKNEKKNRELGESEMGKTRQR